MVTKLNESYEAFLKSRSLDQDLFEFVIILKKLINDLNDELKLLNENNAASCELKLIVLENLLNNKQWAKLQSKSFILFLQKFFKAFQIYEKDNIIELELSPPLMSQLFDFVENYSIEGTTKNRDYKETLRDFSNSVKLFYVTEKCKSLVQKYKQARIIEIVVLFPEYFEDMKEKLYNQFVENEKLGDETLIICLKKLIHHKMIEFQEKSFNQLKPFLDNLKYNSDKKDEQKRIVEETIRELDGSLLKFENDTEAERIKSMAYLESSSYKVINFNRMISELSLAIKQNKSVTISYESFLKCFQCFRCFEDISVAASVFTETEPKDWLHNLIVESVIEKYCLFYHDKYPIQCLDDENVKLVRSKMKNINDRILFVFNNLFTYEYIEMRYNKSVKSSEENKFERTKLTQKKFDNLISLMQGLIYSKEILDQLSDATLIVWETLINELLFNQYFNRKMNKLDINTNDEGVEKFLLYLNRIRLQVGNENRGKFMNFFNDICRKLKQKNIKIAIELIEAIQYQFITFEQACEVVSSSEMQHWPSEINKLKKTFINSHRSQTERTAHQIIDIMLRSQSGESESLSRMTLQKIADEARSFKMKAEKMKSNDGDEKSKVEKEVSKILNDKDYQQNAENYVHTHLEQVVPLLLYAWYVANKPQFPKDTQIVALLIFVHSRDSGMLEQVKTGEGKTLTVALVAAFMALCGKAVDIVSSNRDLAIEGEEKCHSFYELLKIDSGHILSEDEEERKHAYRPHLNTHQGNVVYGEVGSFQRDILEEEFNNKEITGKRYKDRGKCLIVDEVDNMCLDRARHVLYLSHEIECLKWLESLFIIIWAAVLRAEIKDEDDVSAHVTDIGKFIQNIIGSNRIQIPAYLHNYINYKLDRWVESAFQARMMRENDHFIVDVSKSENNAIARLL
jgi:hypothetical protein